MAPGRILVVDDEADQRELVRDLLELFGYRVSVAANGQEALACLQESELPALILLDITMPVMSGREFLREVACSFPHLARISVAVVSAVTDFADLDDRYSNVVAVIRKPLEIERLRSIAHQFAGGTPPLTVEAAPPGARRLAGRSVGRSPGRC